MPDNVNRIHEQVMKLYGDHIAAYARGTAELEKSAVSVVAPAIAALTMSEEYAAIILTSRMDSELRKMIERVLHRQGDVEELLFDFNMAFGTFSAKAAAAYSFGFITKKMYDAVTCCRKIRNAYAHTDNPDDARTLQNYLKPKSRLMTLDSDHAQRCIEKFRQLRAYCEQTGIINLAAECSEVSALMMSICENLGFAAFYSLAGATDRVRVLPAFFGDGDALAVQELEGKAAGTSQ